MKKHMVIFALAVGLVAVLILSTVVYSVDQMTDIVLLKTFNRIGEPQWGSQGEHAGLHFKWPWPVQKVVRYDSRQMVLEDPLQELTTSDKQNLLVTMYCAWRIKDPVQFYRALQTPEQATETLQNRLRSIKAGVIARHPMGDMVNTDPKRMRLAQIEQEVRQTLVDQADGYGIEVTQLGVKELALNPRISEAVIQSQIKERESEAQTYQTAGEAHATAIVERANAARGMIMAFADRNASAIRGEGDTNAARLLPTFRKNEKFSMYLRLLETIKTSLSRQTEIMLDSTGSWVPLPPSMEALGMPAAKTTGTAAVNESK